MASVFKVRDRRPVPAGAEIVLRKDKKYARVKTARGKTTSYELAEDDPAMMLVERRAWYIEYINALGKRVKVKGFPDKEASEQEGRRLEKKAARARAGLETEDDYRLGMSFEEALDAWVAELKRLGMSKSYVYNMGLLNRRVAQACSWKVLADISSSDLTGWLARPEQAALAGRTQNEYVATVRAFVNWCCDQQPPWMPGNPLSRIKRADESVKRREKRALTLEELLRLKEVSGPRWPVYLAAALTGLRRSELRRLEWGDIRLDAEQPYIQLRAAATKAKRADIIPINPELLEALKELRPDDPAASDRVFDGIPCYLTYRRDVEKRAKIPWRDGHGRLASFHCLRKTFGTYLALANVPLRVAMDMMRVTEAKLLTGIYTDARLLNTSAAANKLPRLGGATPEG